MGLRKNVGGSRSGTPFLVDSPYFDPSNLMNPYVNGQSRDPKTRFGKRSVNPMRSSFTLSTKSICVLGSYGLFLFWNFYLFRFRK